ncbi:Carbon monoxide dehydrogenase medium chain [Thermoflexales bacterium]|nr:Carbon monoxide dehydrogenase medium chain [Thermoflexales bacterium]
MPTLRELTEYHQPTTLDEALKLLRRTSVKTVPLAGGTSLVPEAAHDVQAVVDLNALGLSYLQTSEDFAEHLVIGATTKLQAIVDDAAARTYANGVLVTAILDAASRNTREAASLAGSIVAAPGNSPLFTVLLALDAHLTVRTARSTRQDEIALPYWAPQPRALILRVTLPAWPDNLHAAYEKVARTPADQPIVCVAARARVADQQLHDIRLALGGVAEKPIVITQPAGAVDDLAQLAVSAITPPDDYFATADYRRAMVGVLTKRVLNAMTQSG